MVVAEMVNYKLIFLTLNYASIQHIGLRTDSAEPLLIM